MKLKVKSKIALVTAASCLLAMSSATAFAQGNSAFGRGQRVNHFKGRGNSAFGRANAMIHSAGHGNSAFGLGQFNGPITGSSNSAFAHPRQTFTPSGMRTWSGERWGSRNWSGSNWGSDWHHHNNSDVIFIGEFGFPWWWGWGWGPWAGGWGWDYGYPYYGYGYYPYGYGGAYAYGYVVGYAANVCGSPFINSCVGGPHRTQWWRRRFTNNFVDAWVHGRYELDPRPVPADVPSPPYPDWPNLAVANLQQRHTGVATLHRYRDYIPVNLVVAHGPLSLDNRINGM